MTRPPHYNRHGVTVLAGDCLEVLAELDDSSVDAVVCDPPYALPGGFMGKAWDSYDGREDAGFIYWLSGLIDGEGHFAIRAHSRGTHAPYFQLSMRLDERGTLEIIQRTLGVGSITVVKHEPNPVVRWIVQDKAGCQLLVDLLDKYPLRAKKRMDYAVWREAVCEWSSRPRGNRWHGGADNTRMAALRGRLMEGRRYVEPAWSGHAFQDWCRQWATECLRVLKPGGHLAAFGGTRTYHRLTCGIEDAGFEVRDSIGVPLMAWVHGQGFPKSLDVSKAIDKAAGAEREPGTPGRYSSRRPRADVTAQSAYADGVGDYGSSLVTAPATDAARRWQGWGTALRPAWEPIVLARKPLSSTVAGTVLEHGTGALNIAATRVGLNGERPPRGSGNDLGYHGSGSGTGGNETPAAGRWPANVLLVHAPSCGDGGCAPGCPVAELDAQSGASRDGVAVQRNGGGQRIFNEGDGLTRPDQGYGGEGGASRFFPVFRWEAKAPTSERPQVGGVSHPTVKPLDLMRWLVRLLTPPGGLVLDPFAGSGTTGHAARAEGMRALLIERDPDYLPLIVARLDARPRAATPTPAAAAAHDEPLDLLDLLDNGDGAA